MTWVFCILGILGAFLFFELGIGWAERKYKPIGSLIAHDDGYLYVCFDDNKSKELAFNGKDGDVFTFRFVDQRQREENN